MAKISQCEKIAEILRAEGRIDNFRAIREMITLRLGARAFDLERRGWKFRKYFANPERTNFVYEVVEEPDEREAEFEAEQAEKTQLQTFEMSRGCQMKLI
jgi:hypothetical protein